MTTVCLGFDFDALGIWISTFKQITPTPLSRGEFGGRVGVTRILDVLAERKVQGTFFVPAHSARSFPDAVRRMVAEGHEVASHGLVHESPVSLSVAEEEDNLLRARAILAEIAGEVPSGYRSPAWDLSDNTITLLEKLGYIYDSSLMAEDFRPYWARKGDVVNEDCFTPGNVSRILEFPVAWELDDYPYFHFATRPINVGLRNVEDVFSIWKAEFDYCHRKVDGGVFNLTCHPEIIGRGPRIEMFRRLVAYMQDEGAEFSTMRDFAKNYSE